MDEPIKRVRVLIDPALSEGQRELLRRRLERTMRFEVVLADDPRGIDMQLGVQEDVIDIARLHHESRRLSEQMIAELQSAPPATEQCCPGDEIGRMRGDGRRELLTNAAGTYRWPEPRRKRGRK